MWKKRDHVFCSLLIFLSILSAFAKEDLLPLNRQAHPLLSRQIIAWINQLENENEWSTAMQNIRSLGKIAEPLLLKALAGKTKPIMKIRILQILEKQVGGDCSDALLQCLANPNNSIEVKAQTINALESFPTEKVLDALLRCASNSNLDPRLYAGAADVLCRLPGDSAIPRLIELLKHWDRAVVAKAHRRLCEISGKFEASRDFTFWQKWWEEYEDTLEDSRR